MTIRSVAVLGAGTMGAQIAAHLANAGLPVLLLDLTADVAAEGLKRARALKPDPFFTPDVAARITTGGFDADLPAIATADWIMEAVVERLDVKRPLLERVDAARRPGSIVSTNTSGIPVSSLAEGRSADFRRHFLGTHFFNPPRYLHLLEVVPTADTDPAVVEAIAEFADHRLGKGVVVAKDTPNFIANHIGVYGVAQVLRALASGKYTIEEIDAITGPALGRPKSATFRTMDIAGLDVLAHVAKNLHADVPPLVGAMVERGWTGEKSGQGFYKRVKGAAGTEIQTLDPQTMTYRPKQPAKLPSLDAARSIDDTRERVRTLVAGKDKVGDFLRDTLEPTLRYAAKVAPDIAYSPGDIDRAMKWGFGWELGPFELMEALGLAANDAAERPVLTILKAAKDRAAVVKKNAGASLIDIGDGVLALEFHSKMNAIGGDTMQMIRAGVKEAAANFAALVVGNDAANFSVGANLMLLLLEAQEGNWDEIELGLRMFQDATQALRFADVPVIVAPAGMTLGGGCEIVLHADRVQAAAESYIGLVEVGVGLIPAGGGTKEMVARSVEDLPPQTDLLAFAQRVFETIGFARVSTSAADARRLGFLEEADRVTMNRDRLIADAKAFALERVREGYQRPAPRTAIPVGGESVLAALKLGVHLAWRGGRITDHDAVVGRALANVIAGGALPHPTTVSEQYLLDLEREAFLKLSGERKTLERIQHTLKTGKPLRN
ncbi:MAG TPA: 3-hydroxyacyl-CoA dehydrogenase NAD-binding domain-containing protein [Vicinamibacterales bacterium]|nr:3-hydroxyacyl-CoA dehydrogenase NAD-binding domain-containing protein [Vicinamibacterales bacterium]